MNAIQEFESLFEGNKKFSFDYEQEVISFDNSSSKKDNFKVGLFFTAFFVLMMSIGNWQNFNFAYLIYSISIGVFISLFSLSGKNEFVLDFKKQTFVKKSLFKKRQVRFSDIQEIKLVKVYINFIPVNYKIDFITKKGKSNCMFLGVESKEKAEDISHWCYKYIV